MRGGAGLDRCTDRRVRHRRVFIVDDIWQDATVQGDAAAHVIVKTLLLLRLNLEMPAKTCTHVGSRVASAMSSGMVVEV